MPSWFLPIDWTSIGSDIRHFQLDTNESWAKGVCSTDSESHRAKLRSTVANLCLPSGVRVDREHPVSGPRFPPSLLPPPHDIEPWTWCIFANPNYTMSDCCQAEDVPSKHGHTQWRRLWLTLVAPITSPHQTTKMAGLLLPRMYLNMQTIWIRLIPQLIQVSHQPPSSTTTACHVRQAFTTYTTFPIALHTPTRLAPRDLWDSHASVAQSLSTVPCFPQLIPKPPPQPVPDEWRTVQIVYNNNNIWNPTTELYLSMPVWRTFTGKSNRHPNWAGWFLSTPSAEGGGHAAIDSTIFDYFMYRCAG